MFIRNAWYIAAEPQELSGNTLLGRTILGEPLVFFRGKDGKPAAARDVCPHRYAPLSRGRLEDGALRCPYHGALYGADGRCLVVPGQSSNAGTDARLTVYPVVEKHGYVWIWMGAPDRANEDDGIPPFFAVADSGRSGWAGRHDKFLSMPIYWELVNDNLHDITHTEWVHPETIGAELMGKLFRLAKGEETPTMYARKDFTENTIALRFHIEDTQAGAMFHQMVGAKRGEDTYRGNVDLDLLIDYAAPSYYNFNPRPRPVGERDEDAIQFQSLHAITPETESSSHYFFYSAHNYRGSPERVAEFTTFIADGLTFAFGQDKDLITEQMKRVPDGGRDIDSLTRVSFMGDMLPIMGRKMVRKLIARETAEAREVAAE